VSCILRERGGPKRLVGEGTRNGTPVRDNRTERRGKTQDVNWGKCGKQVVGWRSAGFFWVDTRGGIFRPKRLQQCLLWGEVAKRLGRDEKAKEETSVSFGAVKPFSPPIRGKIAGGGGTTGGRKKDSSKIRRKSQSLEEYSQRESLRQAQSDRIP